MKDDAGRLQDILEAIQKDIPKLKRRIEQIVTSGGGAHS